MTWKKKIQSVELWLSLKTVSKKKGRSFLPKNTKVDKSTLSTKYNPESIKMWWYQRAKQRNVKILYSQKNNIQKMRTVDTDKKT